MAGVGRLKRCSARLRLEGLILRRPCPPGAFYGQEDTHITDVKRSERLFALLVITLVWAVRVGEFVSSLRPSEIKKHGYAQWSVFRRGLDCLKQILLTGSSNGFVLDDVVRLLSSS